MQEAYGNIPNEFLNHIPISPYEFTPPKVYSEEEYHRTFDYSRREGIPFRVKSKNFPCEFQFPTDYLSCTMYKDHHHQEEFKTLYLILNLPEYINVSTYWETANGSLKLKNEYVRLTKRNIILNPSFSISYDESSKYIWALYLLRIKYNILQDTMRCSYRLPIITKKSVFKMMTRKEPYFYSHPCRPDFFSQNVKTYLATSIKDEPEMYINYFKLIFWQMYQPANFKIKEICGFSGTLGLEAKTSGTPSPLIKANFGGGFSVGLDAFDITFQQNAIISSNIHGTMVIPGFRDTTGADAEINIDAWIGTNGEFSVTASENQGITALRIPDILDVTVKSLSVGRKEERFFVAVSGANPKVPAFIGNTHLEPPEKRRA